jgi:hypothetical protein
MTTEALYDCHKCGQQYNIKVLKKCPACQSSFQFIHAPEVSPEPISRTASKPSSQPSKTATIRTAVKTDSNDAIAQQNQPQVIPQVWSSLKAGYAQEASTSARTIDRYGSLIQILGYIAAAATFLFTTFVWGPANDAEAIGFYLGLLLAVFVAGTYQALGALYRMVANYVLFRTSSEFIHR